VTKRQALKALVAAAIPWHLGWTDPPSVPGPYMIVLDDVSEFIIARNGRHVSVPVDDLMRALKSGEKVS
jgi:hypothetical protein